MNKTRRPIVFVPNKSHHDFSSAERFGELVFLTEGIVSKYAVNNLYRQCSAIMEEAQPGDYILISSLSIINAVAASIMAAKFGRVNFLLFDRGAYTPREIVIDPEENGATEDEEETTEA